MKKSIFIVFLIFLLAGGGAFYYFFMYNPLPNAIGIPYIAHQKPRIDPHVPSHVPIADKLDEAVFDGLFNVSANPSGIIYEDGLGELMSVDNRNRVKIRLKPKKQWHTSYSRSMDGKKINITAKTAINFVAKDLRFTLRRIRKLGSMSPDYILVSQAIEGFTFNGPDDNDEIQFQFRDDRIWTESDIKEVLSFKVLPATSEMNAPNYTDGTGPYMYVGSHEDVIHFYRHPAEQVFIHNLMLEPYIDNSTFTTELKNKNINTLLRTPFGSLSPLLADTNAFFTKSNVSTTFFAILFNVKKLTRQQRIECRKLINNKKILDRFFKVGTEQQRNITDYKGNVNNYSDYLNYSIFPSSSYYVEEQIVYPLKNPGAPDLTVLPDTIRIQTCLDFGFREELSELTEIMNDPMVLGGRVQVTPVNNNEFIKGNYDGVLVPVTGYRSNFLFDLYDIFLREPNFALRKINLVTYLDNNNDIIIGEESFSEEKNFFRLAIDREDPEYADKKKLLDYLYGFMSTHEIGDKQAYAQFIDELDQEMALGSWLFSLPSLAYFRTQLDEKSIHLYGVASQLSTIEQWKESETKPLF